MSRSDPNPFAAPIESVRFDGLDLEAGTRDLLRRQDELDDENRRLTSLLDATTEALDRVRGKGTAENGAVTVHVDAHGRVTDVSFTPKAFRLSSTDRLREAVLDAIEAAQADATAQMVKVTGEPETDPVKAFLDRIPEIAAVLPDSLRRPPPNPVERET